MGTEQDTKPERIRLIDCCLVGGAIFVAAMMLCGLMTVITHALVNEPTVAGREIRVTELATIRGDLKVPGRGYIDGRSAESAAIQTEVDVWDRVSYTRTLCKLPHRANVFVSAAQWIEEEEHYYLHVKSGTCQGWVSDRYVSPRQ